MQPPQTPLYETQKLLHEYLLFHYGSADEILPWSQGPKDALDFPVRTVRELIDSHLLPAAATALDLGCAVGRSSFELTRLCQTVIGIDYSHSFIQAAQVLQTQSSLPFSMLVEGTQLSSHTATISEDIPRDRAHFEQGDAMHLRADLGSFNLVHAANLLCRLTEPTLLLQRFHELVKPGGQLLLTTPCTWLAEFTPPEHWPSAGTKAWLTQHLSTHFDLAEEKDLPFIIREHARKYQWTVAWGTRWIRR